MHQNTQYYIIWPLEQAEMPSPRKARYNLDLVDKLNNCIPHIIKKEKRILVHQSFGFIKRLQLPKDYPFKNGQQPHTKGNIVWTDYAISTWPLLLSLLKSNSNTFEEVLSQYFVMKIGLLPEWNIIKQHLISNCTKIKGINTDELDRWYDEISATLIKPQAYHQLYQWFGTEVREVGYSAFDYFMESRDTFNAWQKAIDKHLSDFTNLPKEQKDWLINKYFNTLLDG
ncbi:MAG: hypothetical protein MI866_00510 [Bacteroidales bacterium]|nr:hypothetical protein [Bacteroidales bacterium]